MKKMFSIISKRDAGLALLGRMAAALLLAPVSQSLAQVVDDFTPTTSLEIDAQAGPVNGQAVKEGRLQLNFRRIEIPPGVQVRFKGFRAVALQAEEASIAGTLILYGGAGEAGRPARGGEAGRGGDGGSGYGAGLPGQGGLPNGADGRSGGGSLGPGHPGPPVEGSCGVGCSDPAGGAASGSNGTSGGHGIGCWQGQVRYLESEALGRDDAFDTSVPPGGGSGGGGGCRRGEWAGGGGGGGGSSGGLEIQVRESITVSGQILVNGGPGGIGGDGARQLPSSACGAEGNVCGGGGGGGAAGAGGYLVLQAERGEVLISRDQAFDLREALQADGGRGGDGGEGNPTGAQGPPGGGGRIRLAAPGGVYKVVNRSRTPITSQPGRPACWIEGQTSHCAFSSLPGLASIFVTSGRTMLGGTREYIYVNGHPVARVDHE